MNGQLGAMVKAGLSLKIAQLKQATGAYIEDRTDHGKSIATGYAVAAGLYAAAGIFMVAACLVGVAALFRWIEIEHGQFAAFGVTAGILLALTILCAVIAAGRLNAKPPKYPSLGTRLGAAIKGNPFKSNTSSVKAAAAAKALPVKRDTPAVVEKPAAPKAIRAARNTATEVLRAPASPSMYGRTDQRTGTKAGFVLAASLLGWALVRRRRRETTDALSPRN